MAITEELSDEDLSTARRLIIRLVSELDRHILGQQELKSRLVTALIAGGHVLLEGVPGLAKTLSIRALARAVDGTCNRIQFTPDLLPSDIIGSEVYRPDEGKFIIRKGPIFANFVLADEINRAPAKVQSALLETMQEHQATIGDQTIKTPNPFFVLATQNPLEQEGTYALPEAQIDRFLFKVVVGYPDSEVETKILDLISAGQTETESVQPQLSLAELQYVQNVSRKVYVDERIKRYIVSLVQGTRDIGSYLPGRKKYIELGASPRASISFFEGSRALACIQGAKYVSPQLVKDLAFDVLRHRIILSYEADIERVSAEELIQDLLNKVPVP